MSTNEQQGEPSTEEVLASIRRIMSSEEANDENKNAPGAEQGQGGKAEQPSEEDDDVLELTEKAEEPEEGKYDSFDALSEAMKAEAGGGASDEDGEEAALEEFPSRDSLLAGVTQQVTATAFSEIARAAVARRSLPLGAGRTLEDIVREALVPELKVWLDVRLGPMVEKIVREEIRKMVRRAEGL